ncbi:MAG TPA: hypothetical protein VI873_00925, partial [Candidatus Peribacteraceae bacterium]|nr:hypothetical protein [Candidatus Peribacteraceae bacterium]
IQKGNDAEHCEFLQCHSPLLRSAQEAFARQLLSDGAETVSVEILCALIKEDLLAERAGDLLLSRKNLSQDILRNVHHTTKDTSIRAGAADLLLKDVQTSADVVRFILSTAHLDADICERAVRILLTLSPTLSELVSVGLSLRRTDPGYEDVAKAFLEMIENGETIGGYCDLESRHHTRAEREDRSLEYCIRLLATPFAARASRALSRAGPLNDDAQCLCARKFLEAGQTDDARKIVNVVFARALRFADDILLVECILLFPDLADDARLIRLPQEILSQVCGRLRRESTAEDAAAALEKVMHKNAEDLYRY